MRDRQRGQHGGQPRAIRLQERDLDVFASLSVARYLTVEGIEWLHYPTWRERYKRYVAQRETDLNVVYSPAANIYHRLVALRAAPGALVQRFTRTAERASMTYGRVPDAYALTLAGAELLSARRGYPPGDLAYVRPRQRSVATFAHAVAIGTCYAALRAAAEHTGQVLAEWQGDQVLAGRDPARGGARYDRVRVAGVREPLPVLPDATFTLAGQRYFVEIDRGTTNLRAWREKVQAYEAYRGSVQLAARYATDGFTVLVVAPSEQRLVRIVEEVLKVVREPGATYRWLTEERVHPTTIRGSWRVISGCQWERRQVVDRLVELPAQIAFAGHPLWVWQREA